MCDKKFQCHGNTLYLPNNNYNLKKKDGYINNGLINNRL